MPTEATLRALENLRDPSTFQWYAISLLAILFYIYTRELKHARATGDWNAIFAGLTVFGMDFVNETVNGWIFHLTQRSALWTTPGPTALRTMVGWNFEIMVMFAIAGLVYYHSLSPGRDKRILGLNERWFWAIGYSVFSVLVECFLNVGGHLVWEYEWWNLSLKGIWLIFLFGYLHFYLAAGLVVGMKTVRAKLLTVGTIWGIAVVGNVVAMGLLGWVY